MKPDRIPRQVTVLGLGLFGGGAGAARYFAERGARVIVSDARLPETLAEAVESLRGLPIEYRLGGHRAEDFAGSELVVVNPAIPAEAPALEMARQAGAALDTEINLLFRLCPAPIAAITGTNGKSTTVAMLGEMMRAAGRRTWVGGNLGGSLLPEVERMAPDDAVALELSSFQTERLAWARLGPHIAAVLNITPNHLDRHKDLADYACAKRELLRWQRPRDFAILNAQDAILRDWTNGGDARKMFYGAADDAPAGIRLTEDRVRLWRQDAEETISLKELRLPGRHNRFNAACAAATAWLFGADRASIESGLAAFHGLPDRIELVAERGGVRFYNDSIATTPESAFVALEAFSEPIVLIAGGSSKNLSYDDLGRRVARRVKAAVLLGTTAGEIEQAIRAAGSPLPAIRRAADLAEAVRLAAGLAAPGDIVLMSPASASFDMFRNYAERGDRFRQMVRALA